jgi:hypothetical protein
VQQALVQFEKGQYLDGALSLLQATADVYAGTRSCFTGEMLILCGGGKKRADGVALGDLVWTRDEDDPEGPLVLKRVQAVFVRLAPIWHVELADGQVLRTTQEHPFWVENRRSWRAVYELREGDVVRTEDGRLVAVSGVKATGVWERVYNWEVEDYHTYFVSATADGASIWAHNANCWNDFRRATRGQGLSQRQAADIWNGRAGSSWTSPGGLVYEPMTWPGARQRSRVQHVMAHGVPDPSKPVHSVFSGGTRRALQQVDAAGLSRLSLFRNSPEGIRRGTAK